MSDVLAIAALVGVLLTVIQLRQLRKQRRRDFEQMFVQRYWKITDKLSCDALVGASPVGEEICVEDRKAVLAYLRLSEDEIELRRGGWISADTWNIWADGIQQQLQRWPFDDIWDEIRRREAAVEGGGQFRQLRHYMSRVLEAGNPNFDPCEVNVFQRVIKGQ